MTHIARFSRAAQVDVSEDLWRRMHTPDGKPHSHGFIREAPERAVASVRP